MIHIGDTIRTLSGRFAASWERLPATQRLTLRGLGIVAGVLLLGGIAGTWGPGAAASSEDTAAYTGTAVRSQSRFLRQSLDTTEGELEITRLELERLRVIVRLSRAYHVAADLAELVYDEALRQGVDPELAFRLVDEESGFAVRARSHAGAIGLAQVQLATAKFYEPDITLDRLYDPATNVRIGLRFLRDLLATYSDLQLALLAYNWGPSRLKEMLAQGRDPSNGYASSIMKGYSGTF